MDRVKTCAIAFLGSSSRDSLLSFLEEVCGLICGRLLDLAGFDGMFGIIPFNAHEDGSTFHLMHSKAV